MGALRGTLSPWSLALEHRRLELPRRGLSALPSVRRFGTTGFNFRF